MPLPLIEASVPEVRKVAVMRNKFDSSFREKVDNFYSWIEHNRISFTNGSNLLRINRENLWEDSLSQFPKFKNRKELKILFEGEMKDAGSDAGGMSKEWFTLITQEIFSPTRSKPLHYLELFRHLDLDEITFFIEEESKTHENWRELFEFVGIVFAKAMFDKIPLNVSIS